MEKKKRGLVKRAKESGQSFKEWRKRVGMTQVDAALWFGVHPRTYQGWEEGRREYYRDDMIRMRMRQAERRKKARADNATEDMFD